MHPRGPRDGQYQATSRAQYAPQVRQKFVGRLNVLEHFGAKNMVERFIGERQTPAVVVSYVLSAAHSERFSILNIHSQIVGLRHQLTPRRCSGAYIQDRAFKEREPRTQKAKHGQQLQVDTAADEK